VAVAEGKIIAKSNDAGVVGGEGGYPLPGLIEAHIQLHSTENLSQLCKWGVTTGLDMACFPTTMLPSLRNERGVTDTKRGDSSFISWKHA
jgi:hypothetical protein